MELVLLGIPLGLMLLYFGANWLVDNAKRVALILGVSPFIIGLTIVAFGSSAPEAALAVMSGKSSDIVLGNVIGSNIANIGLVIGLSALIFPLVMRFETVRFEIWALLISTLLITVIALGGVFSLGHGFLLISLILLFVYAVYRSAKKNPPLEKVVPESEEDVLPERLWYHIGMTLFGLAVLIVGADVFVDGAIVLANVLNVSELVIGLIVVAIGTSLPELSICVVAAYKKETEIVLSNIIGSNIFNALFVLGLGAIVSPLVVSSSMFHLDFPMMIFLSLMLILVIRLKGGVSRIVGAIFLLTYLAYVAVLFLPSFIVL